MEPVTLGPVVRVAKTAMDKDGAARNHQPSMGFWLLLAPIVHRPICR
jgi:hypothetical protein